MEDSIKGTVVLTLLLSGVVLLRWLLSSGGSLLSSLSVFIGIKREVIGGIGYGGGEISYGNNNTGYMYMYYQGKHSSLSSSSSYHHPHHHHHQVIMIGFIINGIGRFFLGVGGLN